MSAIIETSGLSKRFGGIVVADDINVSLNAGKIVGLVGPNGAGKTSLINLISGIVAPDVGTITLAGQRIEGLKAYERARRGIVRTWQHIRLFPSLSILENLLVSPREYFGESLKGAFLPESNEAAAIRERALHQLARVRMSDFAHRYPNELSLGKQKLVALARALMNDGKCLLLDEPMAGVEAGAFDVMKDIVREEARGGRAVCVVEHNISFIADLCDSCVFLFNGSVVATGPIADMMRDKHLTNLYFGTH